MQVILLEKVRNLGNLGDSVEVKSGYGRNYLIPQSKAVFATAANVAAFESRRAELEKKAQNSLEKAQDRAEKINTALVVIEALASDEGKLYGSVGANEIVDALTKQSFDVKKREIVMPEGPIHSIGEFEVEVHVHSDVVATLKLRVISSK